MGYEEGDRIFGGVAQIVRECYTESWNGEKVVPRIFRDGGGKLVVFSAAKLSEEEIQSIKKKIEERCAEYLHDQLDRNDLALAEASEKQALKEMLSGLPSGLTKQLDFARVDMRREDIAISGSHSVGSCLPKRKD